LTDRRVINDQFDKDIRRRKYDEECTGVIQSVSGSSRVSWESVFRDEKEGNMRNFEKWFWPILVIVAVCFSPPLATGAAAQQEPVLVGRISYIEGQILRYVPEIKDWVIVTKDAPFGLEDALYSDSSTKAEFIFPNRLLVRIGASTQVQLITLKSDASEMDVASGVARFYNRNPQGMLKVTTPFGYVLAEPDSTFDLYVGDQSVEVLALSGRVDYFEQGGDSRYEVAPGGASVLADATRVTTGDGTVDVQWDDWNAARDSARTKRVLVRGESVRRLPPQLGDDAYDLDESGMWERVTYEGQEREFWRPTVVEESWQPFTVGRWTDYYGDQVWVPEEPFGYVTMHYGNWILVGHRWYWAPPAPAVGIAVGPSIGFGWYPGRVAWISAGPNAGWVPLAPTEVYYSHHFWGPSAVVMAPGVAVNIAVGRLAFVSAAVVVPQASFYSVSNYSSVRVTNINQTTIINNYHAAPVVNNTVINNYNQTTAKYNFVNKAPAEVPHSSVVQRIDQNRQIASTAGKNVTPAALKQAVTSAKPAVAAPTAKAAVPPPTKLTNKLVPPGKVNTPKNQVSFKPVEMKQNTRPVAASPAAKAGAAAGGKPAEAQGVRPPAPEAVKPTVPGATERPVPPTTHPPAEGIGPGGTHPEVHPPATQQPPAGAVKPTVPGATERPVPPTTHPPAEGIGPGGTHPESQNAKPVSPAATRQPVAKPKPEVSQTPAVSHPPAGAGGAGAVTHTQPAPAQRPAPASKSPEREPEKKKQPGQE
jgi:hypothetical protein